MPNRTRTAGAGFTRYAVAALAWVDRDGTGRVPLLSAAAVVVLLLASVAAFIDLAERRGATIVTPIAGHAVPSGPVDDQGRVTYHDNFHLDPNGVVPDSIA